MKLRFSFGDLAMLVVARNAYSAQFLNRTCEILQVGPWEPGQVCIDGSILPIACDYVVEFSRGEYLLCADYQLRQLPPPDELEAIRRESLSEVPA